MKDLINETVKNLEKLTKQDIIEESLDLNKHKLLEMAEVFNYKRKIYVFVYGAEGFIPHFHVYVGIKTPTKEERKKRNVKSACLRFKENAYFPHNEDCDDKLDEAQLEIINEYMKKPSDDYPNMTNWELAILLWNRGNTDNIKKKLPIDLKIINYNNPIYRK